MRLRTRASTADSEASSYGLRHRQASARHRRACAQTLLPHVPAAQPHLPCASCPQPIWHLTLAAVPLAAVAPLGVTVNARSHCVCLLCLLCAYVCRRVSSIEGRSETPASDRPDAASVARMVALVAQRGGELDRALEQVRGMCEVVG
jgi:hypothetical protein